MGKRTKDKGQRTKERADKMSALPKKRRRGPTPPVVIEAPEAVELGARQLLFVKEYLVDLNATQAAIRAGYSKRTAGVQGPRLLGNVSVRKMIQEGLERQALQADKDAQAVIKELERLAFANMLDFIQVGADGSANLDLSRLTREQAAAIQEITTDEYMDGTGEDARPVRRTKVKLVSKSRMLELLGKHHGLFVQKVEMVGAKAGPLAGMSEEQLRRIVEGCGE